MILRPAVYAVNLTRDQSGRLRSTRSLHVWSRVEQGDLVRVCFRVEHAIEWTWEPLPFVTSGIHEQLEAVGS